MSYRSYLIDQIIMGDLCCVSWGKAANVITVIHDAMGEYLKQKLFHYKFSSNSTNIFTAKKKK